MMCLVLLGGVWEPIVKWRTHMFTVFTPTALQHSTVYNLYNTPLGLPLTWGLLPSELRHIIQRNFQLCVVGWSGLGYCNNCWSGNLGKGRRRHADADLREAMECAMQLQPPQLSLRKQPCGEPAR